MDDYDEDGAAGEEEEAHGLEGMLVEITGLPGRLVPYQADEDDQEALDPMNVNGKHGRCLSWKADIAKYTVQLFNGYYFLIGEEHLEPWTPAVPEDGGFDIAWPSAMPGGPSESEALPYFAEMMSGIVNDKGWCLIQMIISDEDRLEALDQAKLLPNYGSPKAEFIPDVLGRDGSGKVTLLETGPSSMAISDDDYPYALEDYDRELTSLAKAVAPISQQAFGFTCSGRRKGQIWMPFQSAQEADMMQPEGLTDEDADAGVIDKHLHFIQERRLCLMYWISNDGGEFTLYPRPDRFPDAAPVRLPMTSSKLLVFRADWLTFGTQPSSTSAVSLSTWILDDEGSNRLKYDYFEGGDTQRKAEALGILLGPPMPTGHRMHVQTMHAKTSGGVTTIDDYQSLFAAGGDGFVKIPLLRFDTDIYCDQSDDRLPWKSYVIHSSMWPNEQVTAFDNEFFGIDADKVIHMAPAQRVILEEGYVTLRNTGLTRKTLNGRSIGVYLGDTGNDYNIFGMQEEAEGGAQRPWMDTIHGNKKCSPEMRNGMMSCINASRISHTFGMIGHTGVIDTACSASLVGVYVGVSGMRRPDRINKQVACEMGAEAVLCMGINCLTNPMVFAGLCGPSMLSKQGRCFTFDVGAEGYARGDGFTGMYIQASESEEDNMNQISCLMGSCVNQDGRSATLTAPNGVAQQQCIKSSMVEAGVVASQITVAECHGTGTALGDPIEVGALRGVMEPRATPLLTTSCKSNHGHLEACAGLGGLCKCIMLVSTSNGLPNIHLHSVNPHLDVDGFPSQFQTEHTDTRLNSNYAGVSSFGFSGTNARADVWSQCKKGPRAPTTQVNVEEADQVHVLCPVTLGMIEALTGEPITESFREKRRYKADALRDQWADYTISRLAYEGGFRYRKDAALEDEDEDLTSDVGVYIKGSWSGWLGMERMEARGGGRYTTTVALGEGRYELFNICLNENRDMTLYPAVDNASSRIWIEGPDMAGVDTHWLLDGRDEKVPAGTLYQIEFRWHPEVKSISWAPLAESNVSSSMVPRSYVHSYYIAGSFSGFNNILMRRGSDEQGVYYEVQFKMGPLCKEEFHFSRDRDDLQAIYPDEPHTVKTTVPVRGPDSGGQGKNFLWRGPVEDLVTVKLRIIDAHITVTASSEVKGTKVWQSLEGWDRHTYLVEGSWTNNTPVPMVMDPEKPGVFTAHGRVRDGYDQSIDAFVEVFRVLVDGDPLQTFYPEVDGAGSEEVIVLGPDGNGKERNFVVHSAAPYRRFMITFDLHAADKRKVVSWQWLDLDMGADLE
jgi:polyketide synthase-associated protein